MTQDSTTQKRKKIVVIGVGGHGPSSIIELLTNPEYEDCEIHLVLGVDDSGGHTGVLLKTLDFMFHFNPQYMQHIGFEHRRDLFKMIPMGDFRANLIRILHFTDEAEGLDKILDFRYEGTEIEEFIQIIRNVAIELGFDEVLSQRFEEFARVYFSNFLKFSNEISGGESSHSIGNIFLTFLYIEANFDQEAFFERLAELKLLPERIKPHFLMDKRLTLYGIDNAGRFILSEGVVDTLGIPIAPDNYGLADLSSISDAVPAGVTMDAELKRKVQEHRTSSEDLSEDLKELVAEADLVILPTGSIANLLPQLNLFAEVLREKLIIWLGNIFKGANEVDFEALVIYFYQTLGLTGFVLQMDEGDSKNIRLLEMYLEKYQEQFKTPVNIKLLMGILDKDFNRNGYLAKKKMVMPVLHIRDAKKLKLDQDHQVLREVLEQNGIKYIPEEISAFCLFVTELSLFLENLHEVEDMQQRYLRMIDVISLIKFETRQSDELIAELTDYRRLLLDGNVEPGQKLQRLLNHIAQNNELSAQGERIKVK